MSKPSSSGENRSPLLDIRDDFLLSPHQDEEILSFLGARIDEELTFLQAWVRGLQDRAEAGEPNLNRLDKLAKRLEKRSGGEQWKEGELRALLGTTPHPSLPVITGFSLMRVSEHYNEIYYADIISDILPKKTIDFIKKSVSVPRLGKNKWGGSVGVAVEKGYNKVANSFLDPNGIVACEDLIGGNVSILMHSVSYTNQSDPDATFAVIFCFLPIANIFRAKELKLFSTVVEAHAKDILWYCEKKDFQSIGQRFKRLTDREGVTEKDLLEALVTPDTQNDPVGSVFGLCYDTSDHNKSASIKAFAVCKRFLERQDWLPDLLKKSVDPSKSVISPLNVSGLDLAELTFLFECKPAEQEPFRFPPLLLEPFEFLWNAFVECPFEVDLANLPTSGSPDPAENEKAMWIERTKISSDMVSALFGQILGYLYHALYGRAEWEEAQTLLGNIQEILELEMAYEESFFHKLSLERPAHRWDSRWYTDALSSWGNRLHRAFDGQFIALVAEIARVQELEPTANAAALWPSGKVLAGINPEGWGRWLSEKFEIHKKRIPLSAFDSTGESLTHLGELDEFLTARIGIEYRLPIPLAPDHSKRPRGYFDLYSLAPVVGGENNQIVRLVASYYRGLQIERDKAQADEQAVLAKFARGASHGLKNALAVPALVLGNLVDEVVLALDQIDGLPERDNEQLRRLSEASIFVQEEIQYLQQQAELFFWVMDNERARSQIRDRVQKLGARPLKQLIHMAFMRGLYLSVRTRLLVNDLRPAMRENDNESLESVVRSFRKSLGQQLISANRGYDKDAFMLVGASIEQKTIVDLALAHISDQLVVRGIAIPLLDAVLVELFQNATKAAFLSSTQMKESGRRPFIRVEVEETSEAVRITVINSAKRSDRDQLTKANQRALEGRLSGLSAGGNGGIQGIWQIRMLCDQLGQEHIKLSEQLHVADMTVALELTLSKPEACGVHG